MTRADDAMLWEAWVGEQTPAEFAEITREKGQTIEQGVREYVADVIAGRIFGPIEVEDVDEDCVRESLLRTLVENACARG